MARLCWVNWPETFSIWNFALIIRNCFYAHPTPYRHHGIFLYPPFAFSMPHLLGLCGLCCFFFRALQYSSIYPYIPCRPVFCKMLADKKPLRIKYCRMDKYIGRPLSRPCFYGIAFSYVEMLFDFFLQVAIRPPFPDQDFSARREVIQAKPVLLERWLHSVVVSHYRNVV